MRAGLALLLFATFSSPAFAAPPAVTATDLAVVELAADPARPLEGQPYRLVATVENLGTDPLTKWITVAFSSADVPFDEVRLSASRASPLLPGARMQVASAEILAGEPGYPSGFARVDSRDAIREIDETNNDGWTKVGVSALLLAIANPAPGSPYHTAVRLDLNTTWDEPFAVLDCGHSGSIALDGAPRAGAFVRTCLEGSQQGADTFTLAPGPYAATFSTQGATGVSIYGVRHAWPSGPRE